MVNINGMGCSKEGDFTNKTLNKQLLMKRYTVDSLKKIGTLKKVL